MSENASKPSIKGIRETNKCSKCSVPEGTNKLVKFDGELFCESCHETHNANGNVMTKDEYNHKSFELFKSVVTELTSSINQSTSTIETATRVTKEAMSAFEKQIRR